MSTSIRITLGLLAGLALTSASLAPAAGESNYDPLAEAAESLAKMNVKPTDSPQLGHSHYRNNVSAATNIPTEWDVKSGKNIKWTARLGSQTYSSPVVANGKIFVGTNNNAAYLKRYPSKIDLGVMLCFDEQTGKFLWQHSSEKLPTGRVNDWEYLGICSSAYVEGNRLWYVTNRDEIVCLDTEGFLDDENDGPFKEEPNQNKDEADVIWKVDMMSKLGASPHNACSCSVTAVGDTLFVSTSNGVDEAHKLIAQPNAPSFLALNKNTGAVQWSDKSPGNNIMHGQWSSPAVGILGGVEQALFGGGDGWLYSFDAKGGEKGQSKLLWKFDCNPKTSVYKLERATRNPIISTPVIYDGLVYIGVGEDPEHGEGKGHLWCIDPTKRGDVSPTIVYNKADPKMPIAYKRLQACEPDKGDFERDNENSAMVWHYAGSNPKKFETTMHRTLSSAAIKNDLLFISDENGLFHCLDAKTGKPYWTHDMLAVSWSTPLIIGDLVYIADLDGEICIFKVAKEKKMIGAEQNMETPVYTTPVVASGVLYVATFNSLIAIAEGASTKPAGKADGAGGQ